MAKDVTIYTTSTCAYCGPVKDFLKQRNVSYQEVSLDEQPERRQELLQLTGQLAVPVTVVTKDDDTKDVTVGFNLPKLAAAIS
jgi:glutaredoxin